MKKIIRILSVVFILSVAWPAAAQSIEDLKEQIRRAEQEIKASTELLNKTRNDQKATQSQLKILQNTIRNRQQLLNSLQQQIELIDTDIDSKSGTIGVMQNDLSELKRQYADLIYAAYKNHKINNFLLFVFASEDFNDVNRRIEFMRLYNRHRLEKAARIHMLIDSIDMSIKQLDSVRMELDKTRHERNSELATLGNDESQFKNTVAKLRQQESRLDQDVKAKKQQIEKAQKRIQDIITEEARKSKATVRTAEEERLAVELSGRFDQNMGKLPYPVRGGVVTDRFGTHAHPVDRGVTINNIGVNISADKGADVYAVFDGEVYGVYVIPGMNNSVMIKHGNYITVYSNLVSVSVKAGDKININQRLGKIPSSNNTDENFLHFMVCKDNKHLNPEQWLRR